MLATITFLALALLPAGWLLRDWKFSNKPQKHRFVTKLLISFWIIFGCLSAYYYWQQYVENQELKNKVDELITGKNELLQKGSDLSKQIGEYQQEIRAKDARILELERQTKVIRSIDGSIECIFSGNWPEGKHPGQLIPVAWNKAQIYVRIFEKNPNDKEAILFFLESVKHAQLPDGNLRVNLEIRAKPGTGPLGQELDVLKKFGHLLVNLPFIGSGETLDNKVTLRELRATFFINGDKKAQLIEAHNFEIPIPEGNKSPAFQLNKRDLFIEIFK